MRRWTAEAVLAAAAEWVWIPPDAEQVATADYQLIAYPRHFQHPTQVPWSGSERPVTELIDEVAAHVRDWGRNAVYWWVRDATRPPDTEAALLARGATLAETVQVLAYDLADGLPGLGLSANPGPADSVLTFSTRDAAGEPVTLRAEVVRDEATMRANYLVSDEVWDEHRERTPAAVAGDLAEVRAGLAARSDLRVVVYAGDEPAAAGGCTIVGDVARLWGAGTRTALRGIGAYRALLLARIGLAREHGATLALVKGRLQTSGPILRRAGFTAYAEERSYCLPV